MGLSINLKVPFHLFCRKIVHFVELLQCRIYHADIGRSQKLTMSTSCSGGLKKTIPSSKGFLHIAPEISSSSSIVVPSCRKAGYNADFLCVVTMGGSCVERAISIDRACM